MNTVKISSGYQITIPKVLRDKLDIKPGQNLLVTEKDETIMLIPVPINPIDYLCGALEGEKSLTGELLQGRKLDE